MASTAVLDEGVLAELRAELRGVVIAPGDPDYDAARTLHNAMIDKRPAAIARCTGVADVKAALGFGLAQGLELAIRGGGHNVAGKALCDGGLVIDLSALKGIRVDPKTRTVRAQPGLTWGEFDRETQAFGLATTGGAVSSTGIAGLTLGGGLGWLQRKHGLTCDNLISADVVTADGRFVTASESENPDLFWGLRGGGGNFGIVTSFEYRLHPLGPQVLGGPIVYPFEAAREVFDTYREFAASAPDDVFPEFGLMPLPDGSSAAYMFLFHAGPLDEAERAFEPLRRFREPLEDLLAPRPYVEVQQMFDEDLPAGVNYFWKSSDVHELSDGVIETLLERYAERPERGDRDRRPIRRRGRPRPGQRDGVRPPPLRVRRDRDRHVGRPRAGGGARHVGARPLGRAPAARRERRLRQLPRPRRRRGPHPRGVRRRALRAPEGAEARLRPGQRLPEQPEHLAGLAGEARLRSPRRGGSVPEGGGA